MEMIYYSRVMTMLELLFLLLFCISPAFSTPFQYCTNYLGEEIEDGVQFIPSADDLCYKCTCDGGYPVACSSVFCSPPDCKLYEVIEDECCKFICLEAADEPDVNINDTGEPVLPKDGLEYLDSANLPLRLVASTVTSFLILALLLFMVHRLRQRRTLIMLRRLNAERQEEDTVAYLPQMDNIDIGIEFPPYEDPPPPYTPPKPPYLPEDEAPPPYDESTGNVINNGNSMTSSEWIGGMRQCNGHVNELLTGRGMSNMQDVGGQMKDGAEMDSEHAQQVDTNSERPREDALLQRTEAGFAFNDSVEQNVANHECCQTVSKAQSTCDTSTDLPELADHSCKVSSDSNLVHTAIPDCGGSCRHLHCVHKSVYLMKKESRTLSASHCGFGQTGSDICMECCDSNTFGEARCSRMELHGKQCENIDVLECGCQEQLVSSCNNQGRNYCMHHVGSDTSDIDSPSQPDSENVQSQLDLCRPTVRKSLLTRDTEGMFCCNGRSNLATVSSDSIQECQCQISGYQCRGTDHEAYSCDGNILQGSHSPVSQPCVSSPALGCYWINRSESLTSQASLLSVCSETGERKRPPPSQHQKVLPPDMKYPEMSSDANQQDVHHSSILDKARAERGCKCCEEFSQNDADTASQTIDVASQGKCMKTAVPNVGKTLIKQCSSSVNEGSTHLGVLKRSDRGNMQEESNVHGKLSVNSRRLQEINKSAQTEVKSSCNAGSVRTRGKKRRPFSMPNSAERVKNRRTGIQKSTQDESREKDIPQFKQYGFIDDPEVLTAYKDNRVFPEEGDKVLSTSLFEKLHHIQPSDRQAHKVLNHSFSGCGSQINTRSHCNFKSKSVPSEEMEDFVVNIDNHQPCVPLKVNFMASCKSNEKASELKMSRNRKKHEACTKELKLNAKSTDTFIESNKPETRDVLNNNLLDNYHALNMAKESTNGDKISDHEIDNLSHQVIESNLYIKDDANYTDG